MAEIKWCLFVFLLLGAMTRRGHADVLCQQRLTCDSCITLASAPCAWCSDETFGQIRCDREEKLKTDSCLNITNPPNILTLIKDKQPFAGAKGKDPIQISPQEVKIRLRPGKPEQLDVVFKVASNLPIDMYFILDFTTTMKAHVTNLGAFILSLMSKMEQFTENIYVGYGTFLDKQTLPFTITTQKHKENPCLTASSTNAPVCARSHDFIHRMSLGQNAKAFQDAISNPNMSSNYDPMEGGLDAMMQAAVCGDVIGWRNNSRRVLVYVSDGGFHFAGDGKLAGINNPNDGKCHLRPNGEGGWEYMYELKQDYPSIGQLSEVLGRSDINTFFVVDSATSAMYDDLAAEIKQAETEALTDDPGQMVTKIIDYNKKLSAKVELVMKNFPSTLDYSLISKCGLGRVPSATHICDELNMGDNVTFHLTLTAKECPGKKGVTDTFKLQPAGLQESLTIHTEYICDCGCPLEPEKDQTQCTQGNGTYECGVCDCNEGRTGDKCQCIRGEETEIDIEDKNACRDPAKTAGVEDEETVPMCSGRGDCKCGQCQCTSSYYTGVFCECDSRKCAQDTQEICDGHGTCNCTQCICEQGYSGQNCNCAPESKCLAVGMKQVCNGHGQCYCGQCSCQPGYTGTHCETCMSCDVQCAPCSHSECVRCLNKLRQEDDRALCDPDCETIRNLNETIEKFRAVDKPCAVNVDDNCQVNYLVKCGEEEGDWVQSLFIAKHAYCTYPARAEYIAMPLILGIIGVGLLLLVIWRILTTFYDKVEYAKFAKETSNPQWATTDNPIYNSPVTTNQNPMYSGNVD